MSTLENTIGAEFGNLLQHHLKDQAARTVAGLAIGVTTAVITFTAIHYGPKVYAAGCDAVDWLGNCMPSMPNWFGSSDAAPTASATPNLPDNVHPFEGGANAA